MSLKMNFIDDAKTICNNWLQSNNVTGKHTDDSIIDFFTSQIRVPQSVKRAIKKASGFTCPSGYETKLSHIEQIIKNGDNLKPYLTKNTDKLFLEDRMLNDWNIYHIHISNSFIEDPYFADRADYLLLAYITRTTVYFIKCIKHPKRGQNIEWARKEYLEIIDSNWPEITDSYWVNKDQTRMMTLTNQFSDQEIADLRANNISTLIQLNNGKILIGPGLGLSGDGTPALSVMDSDQLKKELIVITEKVIPEYLEGDGTIKLESFIPFYKYSFKIQETNETFEIHKIIENNQSFWRLFSN